MDNELFEKFIYIYDIMIEKQMSSIINFKDLIILSEYVKTLNIYSDIIDKVSKNEKLIETSINNINKELKNMKFEFLKQPYIEDINIILSYFLMKYEKNIIIEKLLKTEQKHIYINTNIITEYVNLLNEYNAIIFNINLYISKLFYISIYKEKNKQYELILNIFNFLTKTKNLIEVILNHNEKEYIDITKEENSYYKEYKDIDKKVVLNFKKFYKDTDIDLNFKVDIKLNISRCLNISKNFQRSFSSKYPLLYNKIIFKNSTIYNELNEYINTINTCIKSKKLYEKYFKNIFFKISDKYYKKMNINDIYIKSIDSNYINIIKNDTSIYNYNLSYNIINKDITIIYYHTNLYDKIKIEPKNDSECINVYCNEKRNEKNTFIWNDWKDSKIFKNIEKYSFVNTDEFINGIINLDNSNISDINDGRFAKLYVEKIKDINFLYNDGIIPFYENGKYFYSMLYSCDLSCFLFFGINAENKKLQKYELKIKNTNLYDYIKSNINSYSFVDYYINNNKNIIFIFLEYFYNDGIKFLYVDMVNMVYDLKIVYSPIKIFSNPNLQIDINLRNNNPYFLFGSNIINTFYNNKNIYLGIGYSKIKNGYLNDVCKYQRVYTDLLYYSFYNDEYIRHFGNNITNKIYYDKNKNNDPYSKKYNKDLFYIKDQTICEGFQHYFYFYTFEFNEKMDQLLYFKISDSFIPRINCDKKYEYSDYKFTYVFPTCVELYDNILYITGGEGDYRSFMIQYDIDDFINKCIHDIKNINILDYEFYPIS